MFDKAFITDKFLLFTTSDSGMCFISIHTMPAKRLQGTSLRLNFIFPASPTEGRSLQERLRPNAIFLGISAFGV